VNFVVMACSLLGSALPRAALVVGAQASMKIG
jgi:hypothetical protein